MVLFLCLFFSFKRKEKTDKQYHGQKKRKDRQTIPWSKEKKEQTNNTMVKRKEKKRTMVLFVCLFFSFDHGIVCLSLLFF
jgi:phosphate/sulfate permease